MPTNSLRRRRAKDTSKRAAEKIGSRSDCVGLGQRSQAARKRHGKTASGHLVRLRAAVRRWYAVHRHHQGLGTQDEAAQRRDGFPNRLVYEALVETGGDGGADAPTSDALATRGVVLVPEDLTLADWPQRAKDAGLSTIRLHHQNSPQAVVRCVKSDLGQRFLEQCQKLGLQIEYELHAMKALLPRELFGKNPEMFRMDDQGQRVGDFNCCVHSEHALEIICKNAVQIGKMLRPTTSRYFYWGDDGRPWCQCPKCRELSPSEQALVIENP